MKAKKCSFNYLIQEKIFDLKMQGKTRTSRNYEVLLNTITKHFGVLDCKDVTPQFGYKIKQIWENDGLSIGTIKTYSNLITTIFNYALYKGVVKQENYPFRRKSFELDKPFISNKINKRTDHYFTKNELNKLWNYYNNIDVTKSYNSKRKEGLSYFFASLLCNGCNMMDLINLKWGKDKNIISFERSKTKEKTDLVINIPVIDDLILIINDIGYSYTKGHKVFKSKTFDNKEEQIRIAQLLNIKVKHNLIKVCKELNIQKDNNISATYARHTYSTLLHNNNFPYSQVEKNLGHCLGIADNYIGKCDNDLLFKMNEFLLS